MPNSKKTNKTGNILVIVMLVLIAAGLLIASRFIHSPNANLSQTEIEDSIRALATETPTPTKTEAPAETAAPVLVQTGAASVTETSPNPEKQPQEQSASGYLFIILEGRIWGSEALGEERDITVDQGNGVVNVIHLQKDGFYMNSSTCDNQLCVGEGTVTLTNWQQRILGPCVYCLPHNLQLELVVPNAERDPNAPDA